MNIKFRAFCKDVNKYAYDVQNEYDTIAGVHYEGEDGEPGEACFGHYLTDENFIVEQYINGSDSTGRDIYCGDIVSDKTGNLFDVEFLRAECCFGLVSRDGFPMTEYFRDDFAAYTVVGNIHTIERTQSEIMQKLNEVK